MSVQAMAWVLDHSPAKGSDRLVLLSIANHAAPTPAEHDEGGRLAWEAWPGVATMQREARLDRERTVNDALARLVKSGALERVVNGAPDSRIRGDRRPNLYRILLSNGVTCGVTRCGCRGVTSGAPRGDGSRPDGVTRGDATGCRETSPEPLEEPTSEPTHEPGALFDAGAAASAPTIEIEFAAFWTAYPRKVGPAAARKAFTSARKRATAAEIMAGVERYKVEKRGAAITYYAHPSTWLNGDRWLDGEGANAATAPRSARSAGADLPRNTHTTGKVQL